LWRRRLGGELGLPSTITQILKGASAVKIAIVAPPWIRVPPEKYGGIEVLISLLADGLVDKGHDVTLFTIGVSKTKARKRSYYAGEMKPYLDRPPAEFLNVALTHTLAAYLEIAHGDYDIVHDHTWKEGLLCGTFCETPVLHTIHSPIDEENRAFYSLIKGLPGIYYAQVPFPREEG
jgi:glycosyltransferase involved in cell wall biosynthesis